VSVAVAGCRPEADAVRRAAELARAARATLVVLVRRPRVAPWALAWTPCDPGRLQAEADAEARRAVGLVLARVAPGIDAEVELVDGLGPRRAARLSARRGSTALILAGSRRTPRRAARRAAAAHGIQLITST
jgi:hypothetical protein